MVGDDETRGAAQQLEHGAVYTTLGGRVEPRGGLVEDDETRVLEEDAAKGQKLRLAGGQATGGDRRVEAVGQAAIPIHQSEGFQAAEDGGVVDGLVEEGQVLAHRGAEDLHILRHHAHPLAQSVQSEVADRLATEADLSLLDVVEAEEQARQGALAAAGASEEAQGAARLEAEGNVAQHGAALGVLEVDAVELHGQRARGRLGPAVLDTRAHPVQGLDPLEASRRLLQVVDLLRNHEQGKAKERHVLEYQVHGADGV